MARPVRPGTETPRRTSDASEPAKQIGTVFADPIRASSRNLAASTGRTEDCTRPAHQSIKSALAMWEPSTQDVQGRPLSVFCDFAQVRNLCGDCAFVGQRVGLLAGRI